MSMMRRILLASLGALLLGAAAGAMTPLMAAGQERFTVIPVVAGLLLAVLWIGSLRLLSIAVTLSAPALAGVLLLYPSGNPVPAAPAGLGIAPAASTALPAGAAFLVVVALFYLAALCGWLLADRRTPWPVIALAGSAFLVRADLTRTYEDRFPLFMLAAVLLAVCTSIPSFRRMRLTVPLLGVAAGIILLCWQFPFVRPLSLPGPRLLDPVASLADATGPGTGAQTLSLTGPFHPPNRPVMSIVTSRPDIQPYWRTNVFDRYNGDNWQESVSSTHAIPPAGSLSGTAVYPAAAMSATVELRQPMLDLVSSGPAVRASIATTDLYSTGSVAPLEVRSPYQLPAGTVYQIDSISSALPVSGAPGALDLQLPREPARVVTLAHRIVAGRSTPLARALALAHYLRDSGRFRYDLSAGSPSNGDAVDDFLFRSHRGYCSQFASALTILAREDGIPARLVSGYDSGQYTGTVYGGTYTVSEQDAHSWVEALIPGIGWIQLDPTPGFVSYPSLPAAVSRQLTVIARAPVAAVRSLPAHPAPGSGWGRASSYHPPASTGSSASRSGSGSSSDPLALLAVVILVLGLPALAYLLWPRPLQALYRSMVLATPHRYGRLQRDETPLEYAARFRPHGAEYPAVTLLTELYVQQRYARSIPTAEQIRAARRAWRHLRLRWLVGSMRVRLPVQRTSR